MENIVIKDYKKLMQMLENPEFYETYKWFCGRDIDFAVVRKYPHDNGATIEGEPGRWWVYVRTYSGGNLCYDIALWKLLRFENIARKLIEAGIIEIR